MNTKETPIPSTLKIALPVESGRLHGHFGGCREFALVQVDPEKKVALATEVLPAPEHKPGAFPRWLRQQGVSVIIVGGIGQRALDIFARQGIEVRAGQPGALVEELVTRYLNSTLTGTPAGCAGHGEGHGHAHGHGHHHGHGCANQGETAY